MLKQRQLTANSVKYFFLFCVVQKWALFSKIVLNWPVLWLVGILIKVQNLRSIGFHGRRNHDRKHFRRTQLYTKQFKYEITHLRTNYLVQCHTPYLSAFDFCNSQAWNFVFNDLDFSSISNLNFTAVRKIQFIKLK